MLDYIRKLGTSPDIGTSVGKEVFADRLTSNTEPLTVLIHQVGIDGTNHCQYFSAYSVYL